MDTSVSIDLGQLSRNLGLPADKVQRTVDLLEDGNTVPFITRYRKDHTGGLDEEQVRQIQENLLKLRLLAERKQTILKSIESQGKLTPELAEQLQAANTVKRLEDLYLPFKPKKQTLATAARQRGLEPLAREIVDRAPLALELDTRAADFVDPDKGVHSIAEVLLGVGHLLAERFSERADVRGKLRKMFQKTGRLICQRVEKEPAAAAQKDPVADSSPATKDAATPTNSAPEATADATADQPTPPAPATEAPATEAPAAEAPATEAAATEAAAPEATATEAVAASEATTQAPTTAGAGPPSEPLAAASESDGPAATEAAETPEGRSTESAPAAASDDPPSGVEDSAPTTDAAVAESPSDPPSETSSETPTTDASLPDDAAAGPAATGPAATAAAPATDGRAGGSASPARVKSASPRKTKKQKKQEKLESAFHDYFNFQDLLSKIPPHRVLAINRGERAKVLRVKIEADSEAMLAEACTMLVEEDHPHAEFLRGCVRDGMQRLVLPSLERDIRREMADKAEAHAVHVFVRNLRKLLLQPPVRGRRVLALDPGFRSGCKLAAVDEFGNVLDHGMIHVVGKEQRRQEGRRKLVQMITDYQLSVIAIGNGTGCREAEKLVAEVIGDELQARDVAFVIVNEAGASVYSTSPIGREELPTFDATMRSAVSIGRRLLDPLSELVKINPANIGVGMYQHDVKAKHLRDSLDAVVESCVNYVGVDVNTASPALLRYVSGLNQLTARRLYEYRCEHGPFRNREQFREVPGFGEATFVQAAGFLKIADGDNPLDATWIHPESYDVAGRVLAELGSNMEELARHVRRVRKTAGPRAAVPPAPPSPAATPPVQEPPAAEPPAEGSHAAAEAATEEVTPPVPADVHGAVAAAPQPAESTTSEASPPEAGKPPIAAADEVPAASEGQSPSATEQPSAPTGEVPAAQVDGPEDTEAEAADASVPSLAERASQVDVASLANQLSVGKMLLQDLLHSLKRPVRDPREDLPPPVFRRGIMKLEDLEPGMPLTGTVLNVVDFGAFVDIGLSDSGLVHISRLADRFVRDPHDVVGVGDILNVWVVEIDKQRRRVSLTAIRPGSQRSAEQRRPRGGNKPKRPSSKPSRMERRDKPAGKGGARKARGKTHFKPKARPRVVTPITKEMEEGKEPLRSFSDLMQFYEKKQQDDEPGDKADD